MSLQDAIIKIVKERAKAKKVIHTKFNYRTGKATRILMLYQQLLKGELVDKITYSLEHGVDERTFDRDIEEVRIFLNETCAGDELLFDRVTNTYYLSGRRPQYIDRMDATVIAKVLLESKAFCTDEAKGLIDTILSTVTPYDAQIIEEKYLNQDCQAYIPKTEKATLKYVEDLYSTLRSGQDIVVTVKINDDSEEIWDMSPLEVAFKDSTFYLVAAKDYSLNHIVNIKVEDIVKFKVAQTTFAVALKEKYYKTKER